MMAASTPMLPYSMEVSSIQENSATGIAQTPTISPDMMHAPVILEGSFTAIHERIDP